MDAYRRWCGGKRCRMDRQAKQNPGTQNSGSRAKTKDVETYVSTKKIFFFWSERDCHLEEPIVLSLMSLDM